MDKLGLPLVAWLAFLAAAGLEVGGNAVIRTGLRGSGVAMVLAGCLVLACYGLAVNLVRWEFSRVMGVYVAVFALVGVLAGRFLFSEDVPTTTWVGLGIIVLGGLVIQFGHG